MNEAYDAVQERLGAQEDAQLAAAEQEAYSLAADAARRYGWNAPGDEDATLAAASTIVEQVTEYWRSEGASEEEIAEGGPALAQAAIEKAAEMVNHAHISVRALGKV
jgi:hypothetical protein